jgi:replicative DNA helicase
MSFEASNPRLPPYSEEAERGVLGSVLTDAERVIDLCLEKQLRPDAFFVRGHQLLFEQIVDMNALGRPIDLLTIGESLKTADKLTQVGGYDYLEALVDSTPTSAHAEYYIDIVHEKFLLRQVIDRARAAVDSCYDPDKDASLVLNEAEQSFFQISEKRSDNDEPWTDTLHGVMEDAMHVFASGKPATGTPTGYANIDAVLNGVHPTDIIILAARPSMGKTSLAMNICENIALGRMEHGGKSGTPQPVGIFSLEMGREQLAKRMLFCNAKVPMHVLADGKASKEQIDDLKTARDRLAAAPIYIDDTAGLDVVDLRSRARRMKRRYDIQFIMIDYLQLLNYNKYARDGRQRETAAISGALKGMAKELNLPVLCLSQLSRANEQRAEMTPRMSDLRDSGAIEQDADIIAMLYRPNYYKGVEGAEDERLALLEIAKHRNGPTGTIRLNFERKYTRFMDRTDDYQE